MLRFRDYIRTLLSLKEDKQPTVTYVALTPDAESMKSIEVFTKSMGVENNTAHDYHCTVLYSRVIVPVVDHDIESMLQSINPAVAVQFALFPQRVGGKDDGKKCLVMKLESVGIRALHYDLKKKYGATHDFPTYEPHITLARDVEDFDATQKFRLPINFDKWTISALD